MAEVEWSARCQVLRRALLEAETEAASLGREGGRRHREGDGGGSASDTEALRARASQAEEAAAAALEEAATAMEQARADHFEALGVRYLVRDLNYAGGDAPGPKAGRLSRRAAHASKRALSRRLALRRK